MKAALFEIKSWLGPERYLVKARSAGGLIKELQEYQNLECLVMMGDDDDLDELTKLDAIIRKSKCYKLTLEEIAQMDIHLSIGDIKCLGVADDDDEEGVARLVAMKNE